MCFYKLRAGDYDRAKIAKSRDCEEDGLREEVNEIMVRPIEDSVASTSIKEDREHQLLYSYPGIFTNIYIDRIN